jgi:hypothetical protein
LFCGSFIKHLLNQKPRLHLPGQADMNTDFLLGLVLFLIWMSLWVILCWVFFYLDKDFFYTRHILPNIPVETASEEDIMDMVEEKLEEKKKKSLILHQPSSL